MVKRLGVLEVLGSSYIGAGQNEVWRPSASTVNRNHFETTGVYLNLLVLQTSRTTNY